MSTTATTTEHDQKEPQIRCDQRAHPGDGKRTPCKHIVRIVVVRDDELTAAARRSRASSESHGLTDEELRMAEAVLKKLPASSPGERTSEPPKSTFEVLKPFDIVVIGQEAASVRVVDKNGKAVPLHASGDSPTLRLFAHDDRHKDTVLRVWTSSDTVEYQCDRKFEIVKVERANWNIHGAPPNPFEAERGRTPYEATEERTTDASGKPKSEWKWTSGVVPASANNQQYKTTFKIDGKLIDPDVVCGDPPPN